MDIYGKVAARLKHHRGRLRLTQEELAERAGIHPVYAGQIERGQKKPSLATVARLAEALGVRTCDLLDEPLPPPKPDWAERLVSLLRDRSDGERELLYSTIRAMAKGLASKKR